MFNKTLMQIKRELWENKNIIFFLPTIFSSLLIIGLIIGMSYGIYKNESSKKLYFTINEKGHETLVININKDESKLIFSSERKEDISDMQIKEEVFSAINTNEVKFKKNYGKYEKNPLYIFSRNIEFNTTVQAVFLMLIFLYLSGGMNRDRKDNSIYFWRSLPISETRHVLTKFFVGTILLPLSYFIILILTSAVIVTIMGVFEWLFIDEHKAEEFSIINMFIGTIYQIFLCIITTWCMAILLLPLLGWMMAFAAYFNRFVLITMLLPIISLIIVELIIWNKSNIYIAIVDYVTAVSHTLHILRSEFRLEITIQPFIDGIIIGLLLLIISIVIRRIRIS